jgi:hypothetical protein
MTGLARLRAEIDLRETSSPNSAIIERFDTDTIVEILDDQGDFLQINAKEIAHTVPGFVPRLALIFPPPDQPVAVFPFLQLDGDTRRVTSVPPSILLQEFLAWLGSGAKPTWIPDQEWDQLDDFSANFIIDAIESVISNNDAAWQTWLNNVNTGQRQGEATMDEWIVTLKGGRDLFPSRDYFITDQPSDQATRIGWALKGQVLRWTGQIQTDAMTGKPMYEVDFYRMHRAMHGWMNGSLLAEYVFPTEKNDPKVASNKDNIFDLSQPILRHPQDPEFAQALADGWSAAQYLDIDRVLGRRLVHFNLCGEICVATLVGSDVIPVLQQWWASGYWRVDKILPNPNMGTGLNDLRSILNLFNKDGEDYNSVPVSAQFVKNKLSQGLLPISGCMITSTGKVKSGATIRHWVILEDVVPVGTSGWVRIYNPFQNQEEVYEYDTFLGSSFSGIGMWINP